jgi:hypothetical protein
MWRQLEKQAGVEAPVIAAKVPPATPERPSEPQAGRITAPRRRGWKISTPRYLE